MDKLLQLCLGKDFDTYLKTEQLNTIKKILNYAILDRNSKRIRNVSEFCNQNNIVLPELEEGKTHVFEKQLLPLK